MRSARIGALLCFILFGLRGWAQQATPAPGQSTGSSSTRPPWARSDGPPWTAKPARDQNAIAVVQASIVALGGSVAIGQLQSVILQTQIQAPAGSSAQAGSTTLTVSGAEMRSDFQSPQGAGILATGHGNAFRLINGTIQRIPPPVVRAWFIPALVSSALLKEFQDNDYSLQYGGTATVGTEAVTIVKTSSQATRSDSTVTPQTWYIDNATSLPLRVEYRLPDVHRPGMFSVSVVDLSGYRSISGVLYPFQVTTSLAGRQLETLDIISVQPNASVPVSTFDEPTGGIQ